MAAVFYLLTTIFVVYVVYVVVADEIKKRPNGPK